MPLGTRVLKVTLSMPSGDVVLDQSLDLRVKIHKDALSVQNTCSIEVFNLTQGLREQLLSQFTAWNKRAVQSGKATSNGATNPYINVTVEAGYVNGNQNSTTTVFVGQIVQVTPSSSPPNLAVRIDCYSQQINRLTWITEPAPTNVTFLEYVNWAAKWMNVSSVDCQTSMNGSKVWNQSASTHTAGDLLIDIQDAYKPSVVAYIDNNVLYVRDVDKIITSAQQPVVDEFIGTPMWNTWGVEFQTLFDPKITLTSAPTLNSVMNPSLNQQFVTVSVDYDLTSRDVPFYVRATCCPPAQ